MNLFQYVWRRLITRVEYAVVYPTTNYPCTRFKLRTIFGKYPQGTWWNMTRGSGSPRLESARCRWGQAAIEGKDCLIAYCKDEKYWTQ